MLTISDPGQKFQKLRYRKRMTWALAFFISGSLFGVGANHIRVTSQELSQCEYYAQCNNAANAFVLLGGLFFLFIFIALAMVAVALISRKR